MADGQFNQQESAAFAPGGQFSTHNKRLGEPASDFLMPAERKFPYKIGGKISCNLLKAAISRAGQNNYPDVEKRAKDLYETHCTND